MTRKFSFTTTEIPGLTLIQAFCAEDERGYFLKDYSRELFEQNGISHDLQEVIYTRSHKGVIRALHFQREKQQPKLVRCIVGRIYDVVVDLRMDSPMFQKWLAFELDGETHQELLIPAGCAHGYLVLEPSIVSYKCSERFYAEYDDGIRWNDPEIGVEWPLERVGNRIILSEKDQNLQSFRQFAERYGGFPSN